MEYVIMNKAELLQFLDFVYNGNEEGLNKMLHEHYEEPIEKMLKATDNTREIAYAALALGIAYGAISMGGKGERQWNYRFFNVTAINAAFPAFLHWKGQEPRNAARYAAARKYSVLSLSKQPASTM